MPFVSQLTLAKDLQMNVLVNEITCPNCWHKFPPESSLYISTSVNLTGDPRLTNPNELRRFKPTRFTPNGAALDEEDGRCRELACPNCHLFIPRALIEKKKPLFFSIIGKPAAGKSVFLAAMMNQLRRTLPQHFEIGITEPHAPSNGLIHYYEDLLFGNPDPDSHVILPKTPEVQGDDLPPNDPFRLYRRVRFGQTERDYPRPMFFQVTPKTGHPYADSSGSRTQTICLYDNAGEHFEATATNSVVTQHMAHSSGLFFVFDPLQEPTFLRNLCGKSKDPQVSLYCSERIVEQERVRLTPQHTVLATANTSIKNYLGNHSNQPLDTPLFIIAAKHDAWDFMLDGELPPFFREGNPYSQNPVDNIAALRTNLLEETSKKLRTLFIEYCPQLVATAEQLSRNVYYIPVSATGTSPHSSHEHCSAGPAPESNMDKPKFYFRSGDLRPSWAEVPLLWMLSKHVGGLVPFERPLTEAVA